MADKCPKHNVEYETGESSCGRCGGEGIVEDDDWGLVDWVICRSCGGSGEYEFEYCEQCEEEDRVNELK